MRIKDLKIDNFRGISFLEANELNDTIIIAGQNGSGKSCIFDAIRLLKSVYGGYQHNEWQQFFGEFSIQIQGPSRNIRQLFNERDRPLEILANFEIRDREKEYIRDHAAELLEESIWQAILPEAFQFGGFRKALFAAHFRERQPEVDERVNAQLPKIMDQLSQPCVEAGVIIGSDENVNIIESPILNTIFSTYRPRKIGVIDFHGAQRHYGRENVSGINLNLDQKDQQYSQHALYNYANKYKNVKSEMAANFVKEMLAEKAGRSVEDGESISETLIELFESFFPDKKFHGPQPTEDGSMKFPVETQTGSSHDLDELSSGEKEILYGYLRIRSSAPQDSIILLDEPELHLNPKLIRGLPEFYRKHLGEALQNQLWLVTHSDTLIREAVGKTGFTVFHMLPSGADISDRSQLRPLSVTKDIEVVLADLVGDLAAYRPGGKGLILEGGGDSDFDRSFVSAIYGDKLRGINLISGSNKAKVRQLHEILEKAWEKGDLPTKFYSICDRDSDFPEETNDAVTWYKWNVYHIENYLLNPKYIQQSISAVLTSEPPSIQEIEKQLKKSARETIPIVLAHQLRADVNSQLVRCINLSFDPKSKDVAASISEAISRSGVRLNDVIANNLSEQQVRASSENLTKKIETSFQSGDWIYDLPGREILKKFVANAGLPVSYEVLRNLIVTKMAEANYVPEGMDSVIGKVISD